MANMDPEVWAAVESAIRKNPDATLDELINVAAGVSPGVKRLDRRQFNARYPLQIKRKLGIKGGGGGGTGRARATSKKAGRKVGSPKKVGRPKKSTGKRPGRPRKTAVTPAATGAKRRGRPRKNVVAAPAQAGAKRRGRPRKNPVAVPAQVGAKRRGRPPGSGRKAGASSSGSNRDSIRNTLLGFAQDIVSAAAEAPRQLVKVLAGIDGYVDRISKH